jgi:uroporphyrinogen-III synthase
MRPYRVLITRPEGHNGGFAARLREIGVEPVEVPAVRIEPPASFEDLDRAVAGLDGFDWILLTSQNAAAALFGRLSVVAPGCPVPRLRWAAIGSGTADALRARGIRDVWTPSRYLSEAVAEELPARAGERVLRVRAEIASEIPARDLRLRGVKVSEVTAYRTVEAPPASREPLARALREGVDAAIFTSASTVRGLIRLAEEVGQAEALSTLLIVAIGPVTARALLDAGLRADVVAPVHTIEGIVNVFRERRTTRAGVESQ